jgi:hypothetical protein
MPELEQVVDLPVDRHHRLVEHVPGLPMPNGVAAPAVPINR